MATGVLERRLSAQQPGDLSTLSHAYQDRRRPYRRGETMLYPRQLMHWYACHLHNGTTRRLGGLLAEAGSHAPSRRGETVLCPLQPGSWCRWQALEYST